MIKIENIYKSFDEKEVLRNVNVSIEKHDFISIVGMSGVGKSTFLRIIGGFIKADQGKVFLEEEVVEKPTKDMVMVFQDFNQLFPWLTLLENVRFPFTSMDDGLTKKEQEDRAKRILDKVGLGDYYHHYPHQVSGGMKQRCAIARAFVLKPKVLLMDEPFSALDFFTREKLLELLHLLYEENNITIIYVTHDLSEAVKLSNRCFVITNNKTVEEVTVQCSYPREYIEIQKYMTVLKEKILT